MKYTLFITLYFPDTINHELYQTLPASYVHSVYDGAKKEADKNRKKAIKAANKFYKAYKKVLGRKVRARVCVYSTDKRSDEEVLEYIKS